MVQFSHFLCSVTSIYFFLVRKRGGIVGGVYEIQVFVFTISHILFCILLVTKNKIRDGICHFRNFHVPFYSKAEDRTPSVPVLEAVLEFLVFAQRTTFGRDYPSLIAIIRHASFLVRRAPSAVPTKSHRHSHLCDLHSICYSHMFSSLQRHGVGAR